MYEKPRQKASSSLKLRFESVASEVYVADATPASIAFVPETMIEPSMLRTCFSPAPRSPTVHVSSLPSSVATPVFSKVNSSGSWRVTATPLIATCAVFSTSSSNAIGPPSSLEATEREFS